MTNETRTVKSIKKILIHSNVDLSGYVLPFRIERTRSGHWQRAAGAYSWALLDNKGREVVSSHSPAWEVIGSSNPKVYFNGHVVPELEIEPGRTDDNPTPQPTRRQQMIVEGWKIDGDAATWANRYHQHISTGDTASRTVDRHYRQMAFDETTSRTVELWLIDQNVYSGAAYRMADRVLQKGKKLGLWVHKGNGLWKMQDVHNP